jgi:hypothetical protein
MQIWPNYTYILYSIDHITGIQHKMSDKTKFAIHDRKQRWSILEHGTLKCLLMPNIVKVRRASMGLQALTITICD